MREKYSKFLVFKELGSGGFGSVVDYFNVITRESMAKKNFADIRDYRDEKYSMKKLDQILGKEKVNEMICTMKIYDW